MCPFTRMQYQTGINAGELWTSALEMYCLTNELEDVL